MMSSAATYHDDWVTFMAALKPGVVDLVLTDPPYNISRATGFANGGGMKRFAVSMDFGKWDAEEIDLEAFAKECYRVLRKSGTAIIFYDIWKLESLKTALQAAGFKMLRQIIWQKTNPVPLNQKASYLTNSREMAVVAVKGGKPTFHGKYDTGVYSLPIPRHKGKKIHPTQKPIDLFEQLVQKHSDKGEVVLDPFMGSGTTAVAAMLHDRYSISCDIDEDYVKAARARILDVSPNCRVIQEPEMQL